MIFRMVYKSGI